MNIVICCDGTGNEFGSHNSNVIKLFSALDKDKNQQTVYYHPGIGTVGVSNPLLWLWTWFNRILGAAMGFGIRKDVADCYRFLMDSYRGPQDKVYVFGFSRGAYTARILCGMLNQFGLLQRGDDLLINYAYKLFNREDPNAAALSAEFKKTFSRECKPHFVGVWDTVSSVGWIYDPTSFPNTYRNRDIKIARHAISIDERRCFFRQNLMARGEEGQDIVQVWFPGVHSDIGGGYSPYSECGLSQIALGWMIREATKAGLKFDKAKVKALFEAPNAAPDPAGKLHVSLTGFWWILEFIPKRYFDFKEKVYRFKLPLAQPRFIQEGALVHESVIKRMKDPKSRYKPVNLPENYRVVR
ncbi:MAG TPA: DUF2235 domain-containing protein [bacterium]|nr:DUF2235 domain-containing protein [bacterium]